MMQKGTVLQSGVSSSDFLYNFTNILFSEIVKETILIENWQESDFDYRYAEYINIFQNMLDTFLTRGSTDEIILQRLQNSKKTVINLFNEKIKSHFIKELVHYGFESIEAEKMLPIDILDTTTININTLKIFREFEEKALQGRPKGASPV
jgi:hypothetical protein